MLPSTWAPTRCAHQRGTVADAPRTAITRTTRPAADPQRPAAPVRAPARPRAHVGTRLDSRSSVLPEQGGKDVRRQGRRGPASSPTSFEDAVRERDRRSGGGSLRAQGSTWCPREGRRRGRRDRRFPCHATRLEVSGELAVTSMTFATAIACLLSRGIRVAAIERVAHRTPGRDASICSAHEDDCRRRDVPRLMQIGKPGRPVSAISQAYPDRVEVRGRDLADDLMGTAHVHGVLPPSAHGARADRGSALLPRPPARGDRGARDDADERRRADDARRRPGGAPGAVAAGILGAGPVVLGTSEECARLLEAVASRVAEGVAPVSVAR